MLVVDRPDQRRIGARFRADSPRKPPGFVSYGLAVAFGVSAVGWNGVFVSEIVRVSPPGLIGAASGLGTFAAFAGVLFAPPAFVQIHALTDSYKFYLRIPRSYPSLIGTLAALGTARAQAPWT